ncbi:LysR family transcriptional regulator [Pseudoroseomonas wenyumeiae]|uniref:LysR family transcriptional regulator n=1 Tax=Teichococcus wenyumeiae TaxID=2478470 RepID=A0A3A9JF87_9PROT|nr:LysR family transcriptional regulator [Pseudoroseomonas wenyumeiae]RKK03353.1 LysR family transcriptional regulator [Pseudoroseomonas wenyumeiae]RMI16887.1 LysR family transcriptional regulator [Pseudoroseomonas wenyumeiae]
MLNLRQMEVLRAIMSQGGVTAAAKMLNVSQPSVSEVLRHAEQRLGFPLFHRANGRLRPTKAAQQLSIGINRVFEEVVSVNQLAQELRQQQRNVLRIGGVSALAMALGPTLVAEFLKVSPHASLRLSVMKRAEMAQDLATGALDVGLTFLAEEYPCLEAVEVACRPLQCVVPVGHALDRPGLVTLRDVAGFPLIGYSPHLTTSQLIRHAFTEAALPYRPFCEVEQVLQAWSLVQSGAGICLIEPFSSLGGFFPGAKALPLDHPARVPLQMLVLRSARRSGLLEGFIAHARLLLQSNPPCL